MIYTELPYHSSLFCLHFGSPSKHHNCCNIYLKSEPITSQPILKSVIVTKLPGSSQTVVFVFRTKMFANTILRRHSQTMFMKTVCILRTLLRVACQKTAVLMQAKRKILGLGWWLLPYIEHLAFEVSCLCTAME